MLVTHGHFDHIADAVELGKKYKPQVVGIYELCAWLESKGVPNTNAMNKGGTQKVGEIEVTMVNAVHSCGIKDGDQIVYGGEACGYIIRLPGGLTIYHAGDTARLRRHENDRGTVRAGSGAMLPIGDHFTMGPREAALAIRLAQCAPRDSDAFWNVSAVGGPSGAASATHPRHQRPGNSRTEARRDSGRIERASSLAAIGALIPTKEHGWQTF